MNIRLAQSSDKDAWDSFVEQWDGAPPYCLFAWKRAVEKAYGFSCPYLLAEDNDGVLRGVLPFVHLKPPFLTGALVSLPYCDAGGLLAENSPVAHALLQQARSLSLEVQAKAIEIRMLTETEWLSEHEAQPVSKVQMLLSLPEGRDALLSSFKAKLRSQIKKPEKDGLYARLGGEELLQPFYTIFGEGMRDLGSPPHSPEWFRCVAEGFGGRARIGVVYMPDGSPAAAGIILCCGRKVSIPWASSLRRFNRWNPNMLLYWNFLCFAVDNDYTVFDFGRSTPGEGTYRFKEQWGAKPLPLYWVTLRERPGKSDLQPRKHPGLSGNLRLHLESLLKRLPVSVSNLVGSRLRKYVSL